MSIADASLANDLRPAATTRPPTWPVKALLVALTLPFFFDIGPMHFTFDRFFLVIFFIPAVLAWLRGDGGRVHITDIALLAMWFWVSLAEFVNHGIGVTIEASGINLVETMGAYLIGRCYIRDADAFLSVFKFLFGIILVLLPFAIFETITAFNPMLETANRIWPSYGDEFKERRLGLDRVQSTFQHAILYGVFCCSCFALAFYVLGYQASGFTRWLKAGVVGLATFLSLSSGPLAALVAQVALISWDKILHRVKERWMLLSGGIFFLVVAIEMAAHRSTPQIFIDVFALDRRTAYNRLRIWEYGTKSVGNHPWFGVGRGEWERPSWMVASIDMFWLLPAIRYGLPAAIFLHIAFVAMVLTIAFKKITDPRINAYRTGFLICLMGFYLAGWTVHYWKSIYLLFMFFLGAGSWMLAAQSQSTAPTAAAPTPEGPGNRPAAGHSHSRPEVQAAARAYLPHQRALQPEPGPAKAHAWSSRDKSEEAGQDRLRRGTENRFSRE